MKAEPVGTHKECDTPSEGVYSRWLEGRPYQRASRGQVPFNASEKLPPIVCYGRVRGRIKAYLRLGCESSEVTAVPVGMQLEMPIPTMLLKTGIGVPRNRRGANNCVK
eukprot:159540-Amphidinium_carterae.1